MTLSERLSLCSLLIVALSLFLVTLVLRDKTKAEKENRQFLETLWKVESRRVQTMLNLITAKDFPMFVGMQQVTQQNLESQPVQSVVPAAPFLTNSSEYIPRDDVSEALRMQAFGHPGYGETIFDEETDPEVNQMISHLIGGGQNDRREDDE